MQSLSTELFQEVDCACQAAGPSREGALHASVPKHRCAVLEGKRTLLFGEMLAELGYRGSAVAKDLAVGDCNVFPFAVQPASLDVQDLEAHGPVANVSILKTTSSSRDSWTGSELWRKTCDEVK